MFPLALLFRLLSVWNIIQLRMSINTVNVIFTFAPIHKSCAMCDNCLVYSTSLVCNNYLDSNKCSVENNFHFTIQCLVSYCSSVWNAVCMKNYPVENVYLYTPRHYSHVPFLKSCAMCDNCLVYSTYPVSNNYVGLNKYFVDYNFHFFNECLVSIGSFV